MDRILVAFLTAFVLGLAQGLSLHKSSDVFGGDPAPGRSPGPPPPFEPVSSISSYEVLENDYKTHDAHPEIYSPDVEDISNSDGRRNWKNAQNGRLEDADVKVTGQFNEESFDTSREFGEEKSEKKREREEKRRKFPNPKRRYPDADFSEITNGVSYISNDDHPSTKDDGTKKTSNENFSPKQFSVDHNLSEDNYEGTDPNENKFSFPSGKSYSRRRSSDATKRKFAQTTSETSNTEKFQDGVSSETSEISSETSSVQCNDVSFANFHVEPAGKFLNLTVFHPVFRTDLLSPNIVYQVVITRATLERAEIVISSLVDGILAGDFLDSSSGDYECPQYMFRSHFPESKVISFNWTYHNVNQPSRSNVTFVLQYKTDTAVSVKEVRQSIPISHDCQVTLKTEARTITSADFPQKDCQVWFPGHGSRHGLVIDILKLNVPCNKGYLHFSGLETSPHRGSHKQARICGKLEELSDGERHIYFPSSHPPPFLHIHGGPIFSLSYRLVDYCYNVTFTERNGSFELKPTGELQCAFKIYMPYGNRVALTLKIGDSTSTGMPETYTQVMGSSSGRNSCEGLLTELIDGDGTWSHCTRGGDAERHIEVVSRGNKVLLRVTVRSSGGSLGLKMAYRTEPIREIVGGCEFGWVAFGQFCLTAVEGFKLPWTQAEVECVRRGGHLASVRNKHAQGIIDNLLLNSPGYRDHNAYWVGATDKTHEGDFHWTDGLPFSYTNWFPGWSQHGDYNKQPNDDGLSKQDCVELRRVYTLPSSSASLTPGFMWNDRDCSTANYFICESLQTDEPLEETWPPDCNRTVVLSRQISRTTVTSPGFPRQYPDNADCETEISAPPGFRLVLDFEELVLENEPSCSYDYLEITENAHATTEPNNNTVSARRCGDWSSKLKLLRYVSKGSKLKLRFVSDYSHHFGGYKARVSMENAMQCADDRLQMFNNSCYLFATYPEVTWQTAQDVCRGVKAELATITSPEEEKFITINIRKMPEYRTSSNYWLGGQMDRDGQFVWTDGSPMAYLGWLPGQKPIENDVILNIEGKLCLSMQWMPSPTPMLPSGLYWKTQRCSSTGGYVCKRPNQLIGSGINFNQTLNGTEGRIQSLNYPSNYFNNLEYTLKIIGMERTRIVLQFELIDLEDQVECLYDYVEMRTPNKNGRVYKDTVRYCGSHERQMERFNFVSQNNEVELSFHSDYSISGTGFKLKWHTVDVSGCPMQTLTAKEGTLRSPNYPDFILGNLDCTFNIIAPLGKRVLLDFDHYELDNQEIIGEETSILELKLRDQFTVQPFLAEDLINEGSYVSRTERVVLRLRTKSVPKGAGFQATYKILANVQEDKIIKLTNTSSGYIFHLNYPEEPPVNIDYLQHFVAPFGYVISLEFYHLKLEEECTEKNFIEIFDNYSDLNGTYWHLCSDNESAQSLPKIPIAITSFLNTINLRQFSKSKGIYLNGTLKVVYDPNFFNKVKKLKRLHLERCDSNPCQNGGVCRTKGNKNVCECKNHYTGLFCALTHCDLEPCVFGTCELTKYGHKCHCKSGYMGPTCEQKMKPCEGNPCESRGVCVEKGNGFLCQCHAWWEGTRCERRMLHIPYKPLSERMLHEPFWLGLMTVFVVMAIIGIVWCAKRHFPEKIEKLLAEDDDRNRSTISSLRSASVREQLAASGAAAVTVTPSPGPAIPRTLFGRLGIRKPSILSLTSPHATGYAPATARTFSLDDLLKPIPRRTPSPKKKRNNSTPTKKNAAEKKQILQQLIGPTSSKQSTRKVSLGELIQLTERKMNEKPQGGDGGAGDKETKFSEKDVGSALTDPKLEKKVTFARLLSKVSQEMSSGSEMELGIMQANRLSCAFARPSSTPPSPGTTMRSPNSTSSNQGSDSLTSSDLAIPALSSSISDLAPKRQSRLSGTKQKPSSADSILAMFRNFSSSSAGVNLCSSLKVSPSTTPTASSPQDDVAGDDDSTTSSIHTPISFSSNPPESPVLHRHQSTIEVPVLDPLSAHKSNSSGSNFLHPPTILLEIPSTMGKCLSPIREMPTPLPSPMPSPALTPVMRRSQAASSAEDVDISDDRISVEIPNISISCSDGDDEDMQSVPDIAIDPHAEDGFILEEAASIQSTPSAFKVKNRPPPLGHDSMKPAPTPQSLPQAPPPLIIPTLTIQTPSPTHQHASPSFPGSPPPQRAFYQQDTFQFSQPKQNQRKMLKEFDKPTSLDLPCAPPMITITCNLSEAESDAEAISPAVKTTTHPGMTYLSPFSMVARADHMASESNLSSSGYSSMASPGPSRCGSSNPLCPSEMEDPGHGSGGGNLDGSKRLPILRGNNSNNDHKNSNTKKREQRGRSDSETLSDDLLLESNDEGIGTDHLDEKIEEGEVKSAKELESYIDHAMPLSTNKIKCLSLDESIERLLLPQTTLIGSKKSLQLPSIVVNCEMSSSQQHLSPVSSRSESPLSDRTTGIGRFSPQFYGRHKDLLPFTDSDGLYDFPSSDKVNVTSTSQHLRKTSTRKREKKLIRTKTPSPTKTVAGLPHHLDIPGKDFYKVASPRKRRTRSSKLMSSSSSSDSLTSGNEVRISSSSPSPETIRWTPEWNDAKPRSPEASDEETGDDGSAVMLPKLECLSKRNKISRLRAISHQIRFLRRLELSLKRRDRAASPCESIDSAGDGEESPRATSPLLQPCKKIEIKKSNSIGKLQSLPPPSVARRNRYRQGDNLLGERSWKKVVSTGNGHSD